MECGRDGPVAVDCYNGDVSLFAYSQIPSTLFFDPTFMRVVDLASSRVQLRQEVMPNHRFLNDS